MKRMINKMRGIPENDSLSEHGSVPNLYDSTSTTNIFDATRKVSLVQLTMEALPREDHYRNNIKNVGRPSLGEVHGEDSYRKVVEPEVPEEEHAGHMKLGWIQGCLLQCILNLWGVMLFLRLSWVVGQSGILQALIVIGLSTVVCVITTLSLSAISTNGEVKGGGIYYIISRSLGPEFGASIGIVFAFANAVAASMNTIGFCASLNDLLKSNGYKIIDNGDNDTRIVGCTVLVLMCVICVVGMEYEAKANIVLFFVIAGAIVDFLVGAALGPMGDDTRAAKGFVGFSPEVFKQNFGPGYRFSEGMDQSFITIFAIFFPSVTGIQAGANISGDLKDAAGAIPKGTLLSLLITMTSYVVFVLFAGGAAVRDASGDVGEFLNGTFADCALQNPPNCRYGLLNDYSVMQLMSVWGPFIYAGCFAATLSTAITNVLSVPKILEALGKDRIYPGLIFFSKGYFKSHEPLRGYILTYFISAAFILIANLNAIAPLISNFYLASYGMMNFCCFHAAHVKPLGWRPTWKYYNKWLSLACFFLCVAIMFIIDWITSLITYVIIIVLYMIVVYRKPDVNWGSSTQAMTFKTALQSAHHLNKILEHVKNYRPQILVLTGKPSHRPPILDLAYLITKHNSLLITAEISEIPLSHHEREERIKRSYEYLQEHKIKAFYSLVDGIGFEEGAKALIQSAGIGKLKPNVLMMGYKMDWQTCGSNDLVAYFHVVHEAFDNRMAVAILRLPEGGNFSHVTEEEEDNTNNLANANNFLSAIDIRSGPGLSYADSNLNLTLPRTDSNDTLQHLKGVSQYLPPDSPDNMRNYNIEENLHATADSAEQMKYNVKGMGDDNFANKPPVVIPAETILRMTFFGSKHKKSVIDVWWLYDDGGLTILLPYIISLRQNWAGSKLRVFALANRQNEMEMEERNMAQLMLKLRIDYTSLTMVPGITEDPKPKTVKTFNKLLKGFMEGNTDDKDVMVTQAELESLKAKTDRQLRLKEMLLEHSKKSDLVVMSLPMPRKGEVSAPLYMAWLETITSEMPPFILVRGNHMSVLTFMA